MVTANRAKLVLLLHNFDLPNITPNDSKKPAADYVISNFWYRIPEEEESHRNFAAILIDFLPYLLAFISKRQWAIDQFTFLSRTISTISSNLYDVHNVVSDSLKEWKHLTVGKAARFVARMNLIITRWLFRSIALHLFQHMSTGVCNSLRSTFDILSI